MKKTFFALILWACLLAFPYSQAQAQYACGTMENIHNALVGHFKEVPVVLWKSDENLSGAMYYNPDTGTVSFVQLIRNSDGEIVACIVSVGSLTNINIDLLTQSSAL
jgi:hypothetical protein